MKNSKIFLETTRTYLSGDWKYCSDTRAPPTAALFVVRKRSLTLGFLGIRNYRRGVLHGKFLGSIVIACVPGKIRSRQLPNTNRGLVSLLPSGLLFGDVLIKSFSINEIWWRIFHWTLWKLRPLLLISGTYRNGVYLKLMLVQRCLNDLVLGCFHDLVMICTQDVAIWSDKREF